MSERTFRATANFCFEYTRYIGDKDDPQRALTIDQEWFKCNPMGLHEEYNFNHYEVNIEDITNMETPKENIVTDMEPLIECAIRDWWSNRCEQDALNVDENKIQAQRRELREEANKLANRIDELTESYNRHLMLNVCEDYFVILVWDSEDDSHTIEVMRNDFGGKS